MTDSKTGEHVPFIHLCPTPDCLCEDDILAGIASSDGPMVNRTPEWFLDALEVAGMGFKRRDPAKSPDKLANAWDDLVDQKDYPNIFAFLTETKYDDGKPRMTGSFSVWTQQGVLKASINDRDTSNVCYVEAPSLQELIALIEQAICNDGTEWKISRSTYGR